MPVFLPPARFALARRCVAGLALAVLSAAQALPAGAAVAPAGMPTRLAWLPDAGLVAVQRTQRGTEPVADAAGLRTPLGSVWKLFVYSYLVSNAAREPVYRCAAGTRQTDEEYCCDPGASIARDPALAQSCGPYFEPARLGITPAAWAGFWRGHDAPAWLLRLDAMQPGTEVPVAELLAALRQVPAPARTAARQALQPLALRDDAVLSALGGGPRFKTWSWHVGRQNAGGAAGWLADGTPFWIGAAGASRGVLHDEAGWMAQQWAAQGFAAPQPDGAAVAAQPCIEVDLFSRYPLRSVLRAGATGSMPAPAGPLRGRYRLAFENGMQLAMEGVPAQVLRYETGGAPRISARLPLEDYVARVVDREGDARQVQAARALAIAARSYVLQNAREAEGCRSIADDSRTQRVSPNPPSAAARAVAAFTEGMVVDGTPVRYHSTQAAPGVLSWQAAVAAGARGEGFATMLRTAYPGGTLAAAQAAPDCTPLPLAGAWLAERQQRWRARLRSEPGYEPVDGTLRVCQLAMGTPHSDQRDLEIRVREWQSREGRVTLIHEYLHLAFRNHPNGQDETFIERLAQQLADS